MSKLRNLLILLIFISVSSCKQKETEKSTPVSTKEKTEKVEIKETRPHITLKLKCTKGYDIAFQYLDDGKAKLKITTDGKTRTVDMDHVHSGSGEKYASEDSNIIFWIAKGEGTLTENGKDLCTCVLDQ